MNKKQKKRLFRILIAAGGLVAVSLLPVTGLPRFGLFLLPYLIIGYDILLRAGRGILHGRIFNENFLMAVATVGAMILGLVYSGDYAEAIAVMLFYQVGELFRDRAVEKSRRNIRDLMDIRPDRAFVEIEGDIREVSPDEVAVGSCLVVRPGEKIPLDGVVEAGTSTLNTSALTGESLPRDVACGDEVISGCINLTGSLRIRTTKPFSESTVSRILDLVESASSRKARSEDLTFAFARIYTPVVCLLALLLALLPPLLSVLVLDRPPDMGTWLYRALSFLVASCPCALVVSIPLSFFACLGRASRDGILIKGSDHVEALAKTSYVVFDKTGTLTEGAFEVREIHSLTLSDSELLEYAALLECDSTHPLSQSIRRAYGKAVDRSRVRDICEIGGRGMAGMVDSQTVWIGNRLWMEEHGLTELPPTPLGTVIHVAVDGQYAGYLLVADAIKSTAPGALAALKRAGIRQTVLLTGDSRPIAERVGAELGMDRVYSELLPADKVERLEELLPLKPRGTTLCFVGDGINDAPVLTRADVGIAMGALGSDAAVEAADVVIMDDDPRRIERAIRLSRRCLSIVHQNMIFSIGLKALALVLVALGVAGMWLSVFADVGVTVLAILNATRMLVEKR